MSKIIAQVVFGLPVEGPFDYLVPAQLAKEVCPGKRVYVSFNRRNAVGYVVGLTDKSPFKNLNPILEALDSSAILNERELNFAKTFSRHFGCSFGEAIEAYLPAVLRKKNKTVLPAEAQTFSANAKPEISLLHFLSQEEGERLLMEKIKAVLDGEKNVIILLPENAWVKSWSVKVTQAINAPVLCVDKPLASKKDLEKWQGMKSGNYRIVVGSRSAVFAPLNNLGLMVMLDEENPAYKQEQTPHYHAREAALLRHGIEGCDLIFAGVSFSAEIWQKKDALGFEYIYVPAKNTSEVQIVDMTNYNPKKSSYLSFPLQGAIKKSLAENKKVLILFNRRGFSTTTRCNSCGFVLKCERCNIGLTYLYSKKVMACRLCGFTRELPKICPKCENAYLTSTGLGIEKLESEVVRMFPEAKVECFDRETKELNKNADIIVATSAVLNKKGEIAVDIAAVISFDNELNKADYRSSQKAFSLLVNLRSIAREKVIIQTRLADDYCLKYFKKSDFDSFYKKELGFRKQLKLPPFRDLVSVNLRGKDEGKVFEQSKILFDLFAEKKMKGVELLEPQPDSIPKLRDQYRYNIIFKTKAVEKLLQYIKGCLKKLKKKYRVVITIDVNP